MEQKSSVSTELTSMVDRNILGFVTYDSTTSRELRQSVGVSMTETTMLERCGVGSCSKGVVCGRLRRMCGSRKMNGVKRPRAITPGDHIGRVGAIEAYSSSRIRAMAQMRV
jgi:hypothetical protein